MRLFGLIGKSLGHSWSKDFFNRKFARENLRNCHYENFPMKDLENFRDFIENTTNLDGLNVTIPFKKQIVPFLDSIDPVARETGAVNVVQITRKGDFVSLKGYNTDAPAFGESLRPLLQGHHTKALVLGDGGAAAAVSYALRQCGVEAVHVARHPGAGQFAYHALDTSVIRRFQLIINATPVGMYPDEKTYPVLPYEALTSGHLLYDLVYNPEETLFLRKGKAAGAQVKNGLDMLYLQAELSWKIWNDNI